MGVDFSERERARGNRYLDNSSRREGKNGIGNPVTEDELFGEIRLDAFLQALETHLILHFS